MEHFNAFLTSRYVRKSQSASRVPPNPLTYPKSVEPFNDGLFFKPTSEYRGCPFWAWNDKLDEKQLLRQIDDLSDMGMGGFHMWVELCNEAKRCFHSRTLTTNRHSRTGLDTEYMGHEFMNIVRSCVEYAESKDMLACL